MYRSGLVDTLVTHTNTNGVWPNSRGFMPPQLKKPFGVWRWVSTTGNSANTNLIGQTSDENHILVTNKNVFVKKTLYFFNLCVFTSITCKMSISL